MIVCEMFFKEFYSWGGNDYLHAWATQVDCMASDGWTVLDCRRQSQHPGFWTVVLARPAQEFRRQKAGPNLPED
jgi:hypothetical protein